MKPLSWNISMVEIIYQILVGKYLKISEIASSEIHALEEVYICMIDFY